MGKEQYRRRNGLDLERAILSEEMGSSEKERKKKKYCTGDVYVAEP